MLCYSKNSNKRYTECTKSVSIRLQNTSFFVCKATNDFDLRLNHN